MGRIVRLKTWEAVILAGSSLGALALGCLIVFLLAVWSGPPQAARTPATLASAVGGPGGPGGEDGLGQPPARTAGQVAWPAAPAAAQVVFVGVGESACIPTGPGELATVLAVPDGDTLQVELDGQARLVRYLGLDAPDRASALTGGMLGGALKPGAALPGMPGEALSEPAWQLNRSLVEGKTVLLLSDGAQSDAYGRLLRYVIADAVFVNLALLRSGLARPQEPLDGLGCARALRQAGLAARHAGWAVVQGRPGRSSRPPAGLGHTPGSGPAAPAPSRSPSAYVDFR